MGTDRDARRAGARPRAGRSAVGQGAAGRSASGEYRAELARRRRSALRCASALAAAAGLAWTALHRSGDQRVAAGAAALLMLMVAGVVRPKPDPGRWLRGAAGEVATARLLERLPARHWVVLHDLAVPGSRANIDHLALGPTGVWVVDTKTTRGTARRGLTGVRLGGRRLDTGPVRFEAEAVTQRLGVSARPVVAVHGDSALRRRGTRYRGVRVIPATGLVKHLRRRHWWIPARRMRSDEVQRLARLAHTHFAPAGCTGRNGGGTGRSGIPAIRSGG